jgi:hypothetical protein
VSQANSNLSPFGDQPQQQAPRYRKPRADLYTVLLLIAWFAILLGILALYLEMKEYDFKFKESSALTTAPAAARSNMWCRAGSSFQRGCRESLPWQNYLS